MNATEKEDCARAELVKLAADNDIYFVVWWGHFGNYFVGVRNERGRKPEIYKAMYESFYDLTGDDEVLFRFAFESDGLVSWLKIAETAAPMVLKAAAERP